MTALNGDNGGSGGQDGGVGNEVCSTEVCTNANLLDETGHGKHGRNIGQNRREVKRARRERLSTERDKGFLRYIQSPGKESVYTKTYLNDGRVGALVDRDGRELLDGDVRRAESSIREVGRYELLQRLSVELALELLQHVCELWIYELDKK